MNESSVDSLREALKHSPDNVPLRILLAETLLNLNRLEEAEQEYSRALKMSDDAKAKTGLARVFFKKGSYSACNVILEEVIESGKEDVDTLTLYARGLLRENNTAEAMDVYQRILTLDPGFSDEELDGHLRIREGDDGSENREDLDSRFLQKPDITFEDVGGMEAVKKEIELKIIRPVSNLFLRFNPYGRLLLDRNEIRSSNFVAASALVFFVGLFLYFALTDQKFLTVSAFGFAMVTYLTEH